MSLSYLFIEGVTMDLNIYLSLGCIFILGIIAIYKIIRYYQQETQIYQRQYERICEYNKKHIEQNRALSKEKEIADISISNLTNALAYKLSSEKKGYYFTKTIAQNQEIAIVFKEEYTFTKELFEQKPLVDPTPYISTRYLDCIVFMDNTKHYPIELESIGKNQKTVEILSIDCNGYRGRGVGTCVIQCLESVLKQIGGVEEIKAKLSTVDIAEKDRLYNFYVNKNGFHLERELTENQWGLVKKRIE